MPKYDDYTTVQISKQLLTKLMTSRPGEQLRLRMTPEFQMWFAENSNDVMSAYWDVEFKTGRGDLIIGEFTRKGWGN